MGIDEIIGFVTGFENVLTLRPAPGDGSPEISWGDTFFYYSPEGVVPAGVQPFATIVTKNYPGDETSDLNRPGAFRVNIWAGTDLFTRWTGHSPRESGRRAGDPPGPDTVFAHPVYGAASWLAVVNPGARTAAATRELLEAAYRRARERHDRRADRPTAGRGAATDQDG